MTWLNNVGNTNVDNERTRNGEINLKNIKYVTF